MYACDDGQLSDRLDFAVVWAGRYLNKQGFLFAADLLRRSELEFIVTPDGADGTATHFSIVLPETQFTYLMVLPDDDRYFSPETVAEKHTHELGMEIATLVLEILPCRLRAGVNLQMLSMRAA